MLENIVAWVFGLAFLGGIAHGFFALFSEFPKRGERNALSVIIFLSGAAPIVSFFVVPFLVGPLNLHYGRTMGLIVLISFSALLLALWIDGRKFKRS